MNAVNNDYGRKVSALILVLMLLGAAAVMIASAAVVSADDEPEVEEVEVGDITYLVYEGVYYYITNDEEAEEEVAVAGIAAGLKDAAIPGYITYVFEEDGEGVEITYAVTGILGPGDEGAYNGGLKDKAMDSILLPTTVSHIGDGAFDGLTAAVVLPAILNGDTVAVVGVEDEDSESGYLEVPIGDYFADAVATPFDFIDPDTGKDVKFYINVTDAAELRATNCEDFDEDSVGYYYEQTIYDGVNNVLFGVMFERDYFSLAGWSADKDATPDSDDLVGDCDAVEYDFADHDVYYAVWEEDSCFEDYPEWMMWTTLAIIIILAVVGILMVVIRSMQARGA
ncbi:MAG: hypothetical protein E7Z63_00090 [Thermoplasmata archaeon]|nr:hypothetical protein [Thermoplasmata archaeon]